MNRPVGVTSLSRKWAISIMAPLVAIAASLVAVPPTKAAGVSCSKFKPREPISPSKETKEALEAEVIRVGATATESDPLIIEYQHGPAFWEFGHRLREDDVFFNFQVVDGAPKGLHIRANYLNEYSNELDLFLYDENGDRVASSATFGLAPTFSDPGNGGLGYDYIPGYRSHRCQGYTLESRAIWSTGAEVTLEVWLGPVGRDIPNEDGQEG